MTPIRVAIIGLSSSATTSWASSAHLPYLLSPRGRERYTIVALCNSSVDAAKRAIAAYKLSPDTKAYGDPQTLANDPDIDLVVCCTRVDMHLETILPSAKAGKSVFVEWPLAQDVDHAKELTEAVHESGSKTIMGMQGRVAPPVVRIQEILDEGRIGRVLSSEVRGAGGTVDRETLSAGLKYFADRSVGGNFYTIGAGHLFDQVQYVLGTVVNTKAHFQLQRPEIKLRDAETNKTVDSITSNVPDLMILSGSLHGGEHAVADASLLFRFRRGQPFSGEPALEWTINGEKGELRLLAHNGTTLHASAYSGPVTIELHDFETDTVEKVKWDWEDWQAELPMVARSIGKVYDNFAAGQKVPTFEDALVQHEQLESLLAAWSA